MEKIKYIDDDLEKGKLIDWNLVHKKYLKDTKPPEHVYKLDIPWDLANLFIIFSKRDTGKTTNVILHGLEAYNNFGVKMEWIRQTSDMVKQTNVMSMFDTIRQYNYIHKITKGRWSDVFYYRKELFLCNYDGKKGRPEDIDTKPFLRFNSIDEWDSIKSSYTSPEGDLIVFDEFQNETHREGEFQHFFHIVSTIKRHRESTKILWLGNTILPYNYYFREADLTKYIIKMSPNTRQIIKTKRGMNVYLEWTEPTSTNERYNEYRRSVDISYFGFDGLNSITGGGAWDIAEYPHITSELDKSKTVIDDFYIKFQLFYINMKLCFDEEFGYFIYCRPCSEGAFNRARNNGNIIFVDYPPKLPNEIYGTGKSFIACKRIWEFYTMQRMLFSTNDIGELITEFIESYK